MPEHKESAAILAKGAAHLSKRMIFSYVWDWICIIIIAAVGGVFNRLSRTSKRAFALQDPSISYPYLPDTVSTTVLIIVSLLAPAAITLIMSLIFVPGGAAPKGTPKALIWRRKLWEWNTAWMGLGMALASAFMITEGLKDLGGKPRPHMLAACRPNLDDIERYKVGGLGTELGQAIPIMVTYEICQNTNPQQLRDMFASWPSGHSSFSWAGMFYLSLWVASKFAVTIPYLHPTTSTSNGRVIPTFDEPSRTRKSPTLDNRDSSSTEYQDRSHDVLYRDALYPPRNQAAAPPVYLLILVFVPIGTAAFIAVSRWFDYHHHGFDIISGSLLGLLTSWFSFRWYHLPIRRGAGWSWGARTRDRAYWLGVGRDTYVGEEGWKSQKYAPSITTEHLDVEAGKSSGHATQNADGDVELTTRQQQHQQERRPSQM